MKKLLIWVFALAVVGTLSHACDDSDEVVAPDLAPALSISCSPTINLPSANATEGVIDYTVVNPHGEMIAVAKSSAAWIDPSISTKGQMGTNSLGLPTFTASITYAAAAIRGEAR